MVDAVDHLRSQHDESAWQAWLGRGDRENSEIWAEYAEKALRSRYVRHVISTNPGITNCLRLLREAPPLPGTEMADRIRRLHLRMDTLHECTDLTAAIEEIKESAMVRGTELIEAWSSPEKYADAQSALTKFRDAIGDKLEFLGDSRESMEAAAAVSRSFMRVATNVASAYQIRKRREGVVDFQDLLALTEELLRQNPDVVERLRSRYRVLLIDELQDTDPVQIKLVQSLCAGAFNTGKLFAVGDHKQLIYRFRGADVRQFQELRKSVGGQLDLTENFRSQPAILDFINALLGTRLSDYDPLTTQNAQINPNQCVEFMWSPGEKGKAGEGRYGEATWIARRIASMVHGENLVVDRDRNSSKLRATTPGDIVLLFRAMTNVGIYEAALRKFEIDYYVVGGRAFFAQQEIYDLLHLLRALENPEDTLSLVGVLRSPFLCLSDEALFVLSRHRDGVWAGLQDLETRQRLPDDQRITAERAERFLKKWRARKDRLLIARLLNAVFADTGYDAAMQFEDFGDRKLANLWKLVDLARTFDRSGRFGLADFIQRLGEMVESQPREEQAATQPENADVVRLMSIHQAKGLEFPIVIVPDFAAVPRAGQFPVAHWDRDLGCVVKPPADEEPAPFSDFPWNLLRAKEEMDDWEESLRTLYVACTRARDYLLFSAALPTLYSASGPWMTILAESFDRATGQCTAGDIPSERMPQVTVTDEHHPPPEVKRASSRGKQLEMFDTLEAYVEAIPIDGLGGMETTTYPHFDAEDTSDQINWNGSALR